MKKILIIEDEIVVAKGIEQTLKHNGYQVLEIATKFTDGKNALKTCIPDLILCDINLNESQNGIDLMKEVNLKLNIPFVFISAYSSNKILQEAQQTNPINYITKPFSERQLLVTVERAFSETQTNQLRKPTDKEIIILQLIAQGYNSKEIASTLSLSFHTVETHRKKMLSKFNVNNITQLVCLATSEGWVSFKEQ